MTRLKNYFFVFFILCISQNTMAQLSAKVKYDSICNQVEQLLGDDWFLVPTHSGFKVYFCRSCHEDYINFNSDSLSTTDRWVLGRPREDFFAIEKVDSICYYPTVSMTAFFYGEDDSTRHQSKLEVYKANGIMEIEVYFERKWSDAKINSVKEKNDSLRVQILKTPIYKTSTDIFSDYRYWLPRDYWKDRTRNFDYYFERLPYVSERLEYSIFIVPDKRCFFCDPLCVDESNAYYYKDKANQLEAERQRTLKIIALSLGIRDFDILN